MSALWAGLLHGVTVPAGSWPLADWRWTLSSAITVKAAWSFRFSVVFSSRSLMTASLSLGTVVCEATSCAPGGADSVPTPASPSAMTAVARFMISRLTPASMCRLVFMRPTRRGAEDHPARSRRDTREPRNRKETPRRHAATPHRQGEKNRCSSLRDSWHRSPHQRTRSRSGDTGKEDLAKKLKDKRWPFATASASKPPCPSR